MAKSRRVSRQEFLLLSRELHQRAKDLGFTMHVHYRPVNWARFRNRGSNVSYAYGHCDVTLKRLLITSVGRPARRRLLFTMRHELRHAEHVSKKIYKDYYRKSLSRIIAWFRLGGRRPRIKLPCLDMAIRAERDCNRTADNFLISLGIEPVKEKYSYESTLAYEIHALVQRGPRR